MPILYSFGHMVCFDNIAVFQVSNSAGELKYTVKSSGGKMKLLHSGAE